MDWTKPNAARRVLARNVRRLRDAKGLSQETLGAMTELRQAHISEIESGSANLTLDKLQSLARALEVHPMDLLNDRLEVRGRDTSRPRPKGC